MTSTASATPPDKRIDPVKRSLPVADTADVRAEARALARDYRRPLIMVIVLHALAAIAALAAPRLVGSMIDSLGRGTSLAAINRFALFLATAVVAQTALTWLAKRAASVFGETVFARLREEFVAKVLQLPLSTVERAGTGDLISRTTNDVETVSWTVRFGIPTVLVAVVTIVLTMVAAALVNPLVAVALLAGVPVLIGPTRRYLAQCGPAYLRERASYAVGNGLVAETVEGARTVEALSLQDVHRQRVDDAVREMNSAELATLRLRLRWFPWATFAYTVPTVVALIWGGFLVARGHATLGQVTTIVLYAQSLADPFDELLSWLDELQVGSTSFARIIGVNNVPADRVAGSAQPRDAHVVATDVRYAYREGRDVLRGVSLDLTPGERLAIVGPSGAGKSTLGRLVAGIDGPRSGSLTVGDVPIIELDLDTLRGEVALVTQEHHVFVGTVRDNLILAAPTATDETLWAALRAVDADGWVSGLSAGLDTAVGAGGATLTDAHAQQLALARLVLADPHTLVLDEATSLLDPRAARHLERSLNAVVTGRTVVAIAHRLHTAHDADRVAVVEGGQIIEIGTHDELLASDGSYAALWRSWRDE